MKSEVMHRGSAIAVDESLKGIIRQAARWLINPDGTPGLMLCGLYGNGKTTLAKAIARLVEYVTERESGYTHRSTMRFVTAKEVCRICAASEKYKDQHDLYDGLFSEEMMIIDDLGEEPKEVMVYGMIHTPIIDLLSNRYARQRLTIVTTNLDTDELRDKYGQRIFDRMREMFTTIVFENESFRTPRH